jgi:hypothetical protein
MTVLVCAAVEHGNPVSVFAMYQSAARVSVDPALRLVKAGTRRYTKQVVEVFPADTGGVYVRLPRRSLVA